MLDSRPRGQQEAEDAEGDTYQIYVCRTTALRDMVAEVMVEDFKPYLPLCVEFFGEEADDFGGPCKELLRIVLEGLMNRVFVEETDGVRLGENPAHMDTMFKGAGVIVGMCKILYSEYVNKHKLYEIIDYYCSTLPIVRTCYHVLIPLSIVPRQICRSCHGHIYSIK